MQLAENLPGAIGLFADALTGGDVNKLLKGMESGQFKAADLAKVSQVAAERASPVLDKVRGSAAAGQARLANTQQAMSARMNEMGINRGFGDFFSGIAKGLENFETGTDTLGKWIASISSGFGKTAEEWLPKIGETLYDIDSYMQIVASAWGTKEELTKEQLAAKREIASNKSDFLAAEAGKPSVLGNISQALFNKKWSDLTDSEKDAAMARMGTTYREANTNRVSQVSGIGEKYANSLAKFGDLLGYGLYSAPSLGTNQMGNILFPNAGKPSLIKPKSYSSTSSGSMLRDETGRIVDDNGNTYIVDIKFRKANNDTIVMESFNNF